MSDASELYDDDLTADEWAEHAARVREYRINQLITEGPKTYKRYKVCVDDTHHHHLCTCGDCYHCIAKGSWGEKWKQDIR